MHYPIGNAQNYAGKHYGIIKTIEQINVWKPREYYSNEANKFESSVFLKGEKRFNNISVLADFQGRNIKYEYEGLNTTNDLTQLSKSKPVSLRPKQRKQAQGIS